MSFLTFLLKRVASTLAKTLCVIICMMLFVIAASTIEHFIAYCICGGLVLCWLGCVIGDYCEKRDREEFDKAHSIKR